MIYLDNAATTFRKPKAVIRAVVSELKSSANPGRGAHQASLQSLNRIWEAREQLAKLFHLNTPERFILTPNATYALNFAIKGWLKPGNHVITTSMEHHSVYRPLHALSDIGVTVIKADAFGFINPRSVEAFIRPETALIIVNHSSNVNGAVQDIEEVNLIAKKHGIPLLLDLSQTAGAVDLDLTPYDMAALPGHKGLYGPQGTGALYLAPSIHLDPIIEGGTGSQSKEFSMPDFLPDRLESGTLNTPGFYGLAKGVSFVIQEGPQAILAHEHRLLSTLMEALYNMKEVVSYSPKNILRLSNSLAFGIQNQESGKTAELLNRRFHIGVRPGFHCAYPAHETLGSQKLGAVRVSVSYFNTLREIKKLIDAIHKIIKGTEH